MYVATTLAVSSVMKLFLLSWLYWGRIPKAVEMEIDFIQAKVVQIKSALPDFTMIARETLNGGLTFI